MHTTRIAIRLRGLPNARPPKVPSSVVGEGVKIINSPGRHSMNVNEADEEAHRRGGRRGRGTGRFAFSTECHSVLCDVSRPSYGTPFSPSHFLAVHHISSGTRVVAGFAGVDPPTTRERQRRRESQGKNVNK